MFRLLASINDNWHGIGSLFNESPKPTLGAVFDSLKTQAFLADGRPVHDQSYDVDKIN